MGNIQGIPFKMLTENDIRWLNTKSISFKRFMFRDVIVAARKADTSHTITKTDLLGIIEAASGLEQITPAGLIFHIGRCGSTLLSNALCAVNGTVVLAEPSPISTLYRHHLTADDGSLLSDPNYIANLLRSFVNILGAATQPENGLYLKFTSWNTLLINHIRTIWPTTPIAFAFREPTGVIDSMLAKKVGWMKFYNNPQIVSALLNMEVSEATDMPFMDFYIKMLTKLYKTGMHLTDDDLLLNYGNNKMDNIEKLLIHFKLTPTTLDTQQIHETSRYHSKVRHAGMLFTGNDTTPKCVLNKNTQTLIDRSGIHDIYQQLSALSG